MEFFIRPGISGFKFVMLLLSTQAAPLCVPINFELTGAPSVPPISLIIFHFLAQNIFPTDFQNSPCFYKSLVLGYSPFKSQAKGLYS